MTFKSRKSTGFQLFIVGLLLLIGVVIAMSWMDSQMRLALKFWLTFLLGAIGICSIWIFKNTSYTLDSEFLQYQSGPMAGKIPINKIRELEVNKTMWAGIKPATASKGIIIKYNSYDELYISPDSNEEFVKELLKLNASIQIKQH